MESSTGLRARPITKGDGLGGPSYFLGYLVSARWALNRKLMLHLGLRAKPALSFPWLRFSSSLSLRGSYSQSQRTDGRYQG